MLTLNVDDLRIFFRDLFEEVSSDSLLAKGYRDKLRDECITDPVDVVEQLIDWLRPFIEEAMDEDNIAARKHASTLGRMLYHRGELLNYPHEETRILSILIKSQ